MDSVIPVNEILHDEITKLNHTMVPPGFQGNVQTVRIMQENLCKLIDHLGEQSTTAQGLHKVITTAEKLRNSQNTLYLLKDAKAKCGKGDLIGLLKVGRKHLFLFDEQEHVREVEPLCVLDFFVVQDRQRHGYGQQLFNYMLQDMNVVPHKLAVDGPSQKMERFLTKNYDLGRLVRQNNNFAVSPLFFDNLEEIRNSSFSHRSNDVHFSKSGRSTPVSSAAVGRYSAPKPNSTIANIIHGGGETRMSPEEGVQAQDEAPVPAKTSPESEPVPVPEPEPVPVPEPVPLERPCTLQVETVTATAPSLSAPSPAGSTTSRRASQLTDQGYFDVKFYHNKLW